MFLIEKNIKREKLSKTISSQLGETLSLKNQIKRGEKGSNLFWLRSYLISGEKKEDINLRCIFEKFEKGLLLRVQENQKVTNISIDYDSIETIDLKRGKEEIAPLWISPFRFMLFLKLPIRYARYFRCATSEYSIDPLTLKLKSDTDYIILDSNGYNYETTFKYFEQVKNKIKTSA